MFASVCSGRAVQPSTQISATQHTITIPSASKISHVTLFTLPNQDVPIGYKALIFFKLPGDQDFKLFGGINATKPSAIFKLNNKNTQAGKNVLDDIDMDMDTPQISELNENDEEMDSIVVGISIEPDDVADSQLQTIRPSAAAASNGAESTTLALYNPSSSAGQISVQDKARIASNIVKHIYNYLVGFVDERGMINVKVFDAWWDKFKGRVMNDPKFLSEEEI
ncbi:hypothetical protein WICPIJ_005619 [Wickerhamomyces pijperi]|uniref:Hikeshi-like domain-containing protein n=1 Tax=Wickerhamomyces pijperi TaxID=599730 RepID=A0A9P8Q5B1_WICPI|nr:hypothetical protein WICPIJ_005619 [Wickerhamomyces pijperi]